MAVKIRLKRMGAKKTPFYRIEELVLKWMNDGAKPSDTVRNLFSNEGIMEKFHNAKLGK